MVRALKSYLPHWPRQEEILTRKHFCFGFGFDQVIEKPTCQMQSKTLPVTFAEGD